MLHVACPDGRSICPDGQVIYNACALMICNASLRFVLIVVCALGATLYVGSRNRTAVYLPSRASDMPWRARYMANAMRYIYFINAIYSLCSCSKGYALGSRNRTECTKTPDLFEKSNRHIKSRRKAHLNIFRKKNIEHRVAVYHMPLGIYHLQSKYH